MDEFEAVKSKAGLSKKYRETAKHSFFMPFRDHFKNCLVTEVTGDAAEKYVYKHKTWNSTIVRAAGKDGIELALVKEVLPDPEVLQQVRNQLGTGPYTVGKGTPQERLAEGEKVLVEGKGQSKGNTVTFTIQPHESEIR